MKIQTIMGCLLVFTCTASAEVLEIAGRGTVDLAQAVNDSQAILMAERAAKLDAMRNLSEIVKAEVTSGTTVRDMEVVDDLIASRTRSHLSGVFEISTSTEKVKGGYDARVVIGICTTEDLDVCKGKPTLETLKQKLNDDLANRSSEDN